MSSSDEGAVLKADLEIPDGTGVLKKKVDEDEADEDLAVQALKNSPASGSEVLKNKMDSESASSAAVLQIPDGTRVLKKKMDSEGASFATILEIPDGTGADEDLAVQALKNLPASGSGDKHIRPDAIARQIGEVVDGVDGNMKRPILDGIEYDYVFDVSTGKDRPICKLPYNRSDDAYETADKWLKEQELLPTYRQLVTEFIRGNVSGSGAAGTVHGESSSNVLKGNQQGGVTGD